MTKIRTISSREEEEERRSKKEDKKAKKKQKKELKKEKKLADKKKKNAKNEEKVAVKTKSTKQEKVETKTARDQSTNNEIAGAEKPTVASTNKTDIPTNGNAKKDASMTTKDEKQIVEDVQKNQTDVKISEIAEINEPLAVDVKCPPGDEKRSFKKGIKSPNKLKKYIKGKSSNKSENSQPGTPVSHKSTDSVFEKEKSKKKKLKLSLKPKKNKSEEVKIVGEERSPIITQVEKIEIKSNKLSTNDEVDENVFLFNDSKENPEVKIVAYKRTTQQKVEATTSDSLQDEKQRNSSVKNEVPMETQERKPPNESVGKVSTLKSFTRSMNRTLTPNDMKKAKKKAKKQRTLQKEEDVKYENEMKSFPATNSEDQLQSLISSTKETAAIMRDNVGKVIEREENLDQLYITTKNMENSSEKFIKTSKKVKKKHKCKSRCPCCWPCYRKLCCITAVQ